MGLSHDFSTLTKKVGRPMLPDMETTLVGVKLREARGRADLTLTQLSTLTGVPMRTIHGIENGDTRYPTERILRPLGDALEPHTSYRELALLVYRLAPESGHPAGALVGSA